MRYFVLRIKRPCFGRAVLSSCGAVRRMRKLRKRFRTPECGAVGKKSRFMKKSLIALAFGTLALGMAEFVMMGILPDVARDLGVSIPGPGT